MKIPIKELENIAKKYNLSHVIMLAYSPNDITEHIVTYGETIENCSDAADYGNKLKDVLGWPESLKTHPNRVKQLLKKIEDLENEIDELEH